MDDLISGLLGYLSSKTAKKSNFAKFGLSVFIGWLFFSSNIIAEIIKKEKIVFDNVCVLTLFSLFVSLICFLLMTMIKSEALDE